MPAPGAALSEALDGPQTRPPWGPSAPWLLTIRPRRGSAPSPPLPPLACPAAATAPLAPACSDAPLPTPPRVRLPTGSLRRPRRGGAAAAVRHLPAHLQLVRQPAARARRRHGRPRARPLVRGRRQRPLVVAAR
eukprot:1482186-Prymnesium_polylepis.1